MSPLSVPTSWAHLAQMMGHPRGPPPHLSDPVGHDVGAGGAEMEVEDHHADHHHGRHQQHDEKQVPGVALAQGGGDAQSHPGDPEMPLLCPAVPRTHLPMRGMAWEVSGRRWETSRRKTDWARSTEITRVIFSPPGERVSSG